MIKHYFAPYVGISQQVQRVRFCLLNSIEFPCICKYNITFEK